MTTTSIACILFALAGAFVGVMYFSLLVGKE